MLPFRWTYRSRTRQFPVPFAHDRNHISFECRFEYSQSILKVAFSGAAGYRYRRVALRTTEKTPDSSRATSKETWRLTATSAWINCWPVVLTLVA